MDPTAPADSEGVQEMQKLQAGGFSNDEINSWRAETTQKLQQGGFSDDEVSNYFGNPKVDTSDMKSLVSNNISAYQSSDEFKEKNPTQTPADGFWDALKAGLQGSTGGMLWRDKMPDTILPEHAGRAMRIANQIGALAGDLPAMTAGFQAGAGEISPVTGMAGAFAAPAALRQLLVDHYQKGDITTAKDFVDRFMTTSWQTIKGGLTGAATAAAGPVAGMPGEIAAMTAVGSALEGKMPDSQDFIDNALVVGGLHGVTNILPKLHGIYANTGEHPADIVNEAQNNIQLKQQLLGENPSLPPQAEMQHFSQSDGTIGPQETKVEEPPTPKLDENQNYFLDKIGDQKESDNSKPLMDQFHDLYAQKLDRSAALRRILDKAGVEPSQDDSASLMQMMGASGDVTKSFIEDNTRDFDTGKVNGEGFMNVVNDYRKEFPDDPQMQGLKSFGIASRTLELSERGKTVSVNGEDLDLDKAKSVVDDNPQYQKYLDRVVSFKNRTLDYMHDSGFFTDDQIKAMKDLNKQHFSFSRIQDEEPSGNGAARSIKRIKGEGGFFQDPILSTIKDTDMMLRMAEENRVRTKFVSDMMKSDEPDAFLDEVKPDQRPIQVASKELEKGLRNNGIDTSDANLTEGMTIFRPNDMNLGEGQFAVHIDGERKVFETYPVVADALNSLSGNPTATFMMSGVLKAFPTFLRMGTVNNPLFAVRHAWRNQRTAPIFSQTGLKPFIDLARNAPAFLMKDQSYKDALYNRAFVSSIVPMDKDYVNGKIYELDKEAPALNRAWNITKSVASFSHWAIILHDNMTRFAEYQRATEQGKNPTESAYLARNVIPDYQKAGIQRSALLSLAAFAKVHYTSEARTIEALKNDPVNTALKGLMYITVPSILLYAANQNDDRVDDQSEYMKNMYDIAAVDHWRPVSPILANSVRAYDQRLVRPDGKGGQEINDGPMLRMPTPFSLGVMFGRGATAALDAYKEKDPKAIETWAKSLAGSFVSNVLPTVATPMVEQAFNYNFFSGKQLVSSFAEKDLPELEQKPYTSEVAKQLGRLIHYIPLVHGLGNGSATLENPIVLDNYAQAWGGTLGQYAIKLADAGLHSAGVGNTTTKPTWNWADTPFVKEFMLRNPSFNIQAVDDFYNNYTKSQQVLDSLKKSIGQKDDTTTDYIKQNYSDYMVNLGGYAKALSNQTQYIHYVTENKDMTALDKNQLIENTLYGVMATAKAANKAIEDHKNQNH